MNRIKEYRIKKNLSQKGLADRVGTSQQQIQRWETGSAIKFMVAHMIANVLGEAVDRVFPESKAAVKRLSRLKDIEELRRGPNADALVDGFLEAGIELDGDEWTVRVQVRGHKLRYYRIGIADLRRANRILERDSDPDPNRFIVFTSEDREVAINASHVLFWQNLWDRPERLVGVSLEEEQKFYGQISAYMAEIPDPLKFSVDIDEGDLNDEEDIGFWRSMLADLTDDMRDEDFLSFMDGDGEQAHIRKSALAILEVSRSITHPIDLSDREKNEDGEKMPEPEQINSTPETVQ